MWKIDRNRIKKLADRVVVTYAPYDAVPIEAATIIGYAELKNALDRKPSVPTGLFKDNLCWVRVSGTNIAKRLPGPHGYYAYTHEHWAKLWKEESNEMGEVSL